MNILKKIYCRTYQTVFYLTIPFLPYREPKVFNSIKEINSLSLLKQKRILLVTDKFLMESKLTEPLINELQNMEAIITIYDETKANPTTDNVEKARDIFIENNCEIIVAMGGGSVIDCAKSLGARTARPNMSLQKMKGILKIRKKIPTLVAIPTTAGTGSETTLAAVVTDSETRHKYAINDFSLIPSYAVLDANVTLTLPKGLTSTTGMDALTHAVESYIGRSTTKETKKLSESAIKLIYENILTAYNEGSNLKARENMLRASYYAGRAFTKSYIGYVHAIAHTLGGKYNTPHGLANAVILPNVLKAYDKAVYKKLHKLAILINISDKSDSHKNGAEKFIDMIIKLNENLNIPKTLTDLKLEDISSLANIAEKERNPQYPVPKLMDKKELEKIYYLIAEK